MPVNILTPSSVPQVATGLGGDLDFPENYNDAVRGAGSLRSTEDVAVTEPFGANSNRHISGSVRTGDDVVLTEPINAIDLNTASSLRSVDDTAQPLHNSGSNVTGSPNFGDL